MILLSCVNCCHNPLQSDALGGQVGYCTQHKRLLLTPSELTCGKQFRKDLPAADAGAEREKHAKRFRSDVIVQLTDRGAPANGGYTSSAPKDLADLDGDPVAVTAREYGTQPKIASLSQLRFLGGARPELAMISLGRAYVNRCVQNQGKWTSGIHLIWWTRRRLRDVPEVRFDDLRVEAPIPLQRQVELAKWSLMMMRLVLISDVASYAEKREPIAKLASFAEAAAENAGELSPKSLATWIRRKGERMFDSALPTNSYERIAASVHQERNEPA
jgi:hypothetical protein